MDLEMKGQWIFEALQIVEASRPMSYKQETKKTDVIIGLREILDEIKEEIRIDERNKLLSSIPVRCQSPHIKPCNYPAGTCQECSQEML